VSVITKSPELQLFQGKKKSTRISRRIL